MPDLKGHSATVHVDSASASGIEDAIKQLWHEAAGSAAAIEANQQAAARATMERPPLLRACVLNLVCVAEGQDELQETLQTIGEIFESYPLRSIVLFADAQLAAGKASTEVAT